MISVAYSKLRRSRTGLGLYLCNKLVRGPLNGVLQIDSQPNVGTTITFTCAVLPVRDGEKGFVPKSPTEDLEKGEQSQHPLAGVRVLIADDNESLREHFSSLLRLWGCVVASVPDAMSVIRELKLALANESPYDVLLLDYHVMLLIHIPTLSSRFPIDAP